MTRKREPAPLPESEPKDRETFPLENCWFPRPLQLGGKYDPKESW